MSITTVGIIGAGTMGNGIAQACAVSGIHVVMVDISEAAVGKGLSTVSGSLERLLKKDKISATDKDAALARIKGSTSYDDLNAADLVIEMDEVLEAMMTSGATMASICFRILTFRSWFSVAASITRSAAFRSP